MTNKEWSYILDVVRDEGSSLDHFEGLVKRAQRELLEAVKAAPINAQSPEWTAETKTVRILFRKRAEDLEQFRILCANVRERLAQLVIQIQGAPVPQTAINTLPGTADGRIMDIARVLFTDQYNGLRRMALQQIVDDTRFVRRN